MQLSTNRRNLGRVAGILGLLQGVAWAALSLAAIIMYYWSPNLIEVDPTNNYTRFIGIVIYNYFIRYREPPESPDVVVRPIDFHIFMWIYFILSVGWTALSIDQLTALHFNKSRQKLILFAWGVVTLIICLTDLILTCLLAKNYANCDQITLFILQHFCSLACGITMTIAARGYTLWLVNVVLSFSMIYVATKIQKKDELAYLSYPFSNHRIPPSRFTIPRLANDNNQIQSRGGDASPNFLNNENPYPSFLYQNKFNTKEDTLTSGQSRRSKGSDSNIANSPSILNRGENFSY